MAEGQLNPDDAGQESIAVAVKGFEDLLFNVFGLKNEDEASGDHMEQLDGLMNLVIDIRQQSRANKDWATSDKIRDTLASIEIELKDGKEGTSWKLK
jgi:cysteinyl-tRNA synthetase